jgi:hypothetical protein
MSKRNVNIFFAPVSSGSLYLNFEKSVLKGIEKNIFSTEIKEYLKHSDENVKLWGIRDAKKTTYDKSDVGDLILFYKKGIIIGYSKVYSLFIDEELAKKVWGVFENKQRGERYTWSNIIVFEDFHNCSIPFTKFKELGDYSESFSIRGYLEFRKEAVEKIMKDFGSFEKFVKENSVQNSD